MSRGGRCLHQKRSVGFRAAFPGDSPGLKSNLDSRASLNAHGVIHRYKEIIMSQPKPYEDLVLGSGAGGKLLAWHLASSGRRVAVVERRWVGGSCPNIACLPSKNEIWSAKVADFLHHAAQFGVVTGSVAVDMGKVRQRKREMVEGLVALRLELYRKSGAELIMGDGRFVAPKTLEVRLRDGGTRVLTGERVFLNVGTRATIPPIAGLADARPLTHIE